MTERITDEQLSALESAAIGGSVPRFAWIVSACHELRERRAVDRDRTTLLWLRDSLERIRLKLENGGRNVRTPKQYEAAIVLLDRLLGGEMIT